MTHYRFHQNRDFTGFITYFDRLDSNKIVTEATLKKFFFNTFKKNRIIKDVATCCCSDFCTNSYLFETLCLKLIWKLDRVPLRF